MIDSSQWEKMNKNNAQAEDDDVFMVGSFSSFFPVPLLIIDNYS